MDSRGVASDLEGSDDGESASPTSTLHMVSRAAVPMDVLALTVRLLIRRRNVTQCPCRLKPG